jgi:hypothetical protein
VLLDELAPFLVEHLLAPLVRHEKEGTPIHPGRS